MLGHTSHDGSNTYRGYVCAEHRKHGTCSLNWHRADVLETAVLTVLDGILGDSTAAHQRAQDEAGRLEGLLVGVESALAGIPARFERNLDRYERGLFASDAFFQLANQSLVDEQGRLEREQARLREAIVRAKLTIDNVEAVRGFRTVREAFATMSLGEQKAWLQQIIERVDCDAKEQPRVRLRY